MTIASLIVVRLGSLAVAAPSAWGFHSGLIPLVLFYCSSTSSITSCATNPATASTSSRSRFLSSRSRRLFSGGGPQRGQRTCPVPGRVYNTPSRAPVPCKPGRPYRNRSRAFAIVPGPTVAARPVEAGLWRHPAGDSPRPIADRSGRPRSGGIDNSSCARAVLIVLIDCPCKMEKLPPTKQPESVQFRVSMSLHTAPGDLPAESGPLGYPSPKALSARSKDNSDWPQLRSIRRAPERRISVLFRPVREPPPHRSRPAMAGSKHTLTAW